MVVRFEFCFDLNVQNRTLWRRSEQWEFGAEPSVEAGCTLISPSNCYEFPSAVWQGGGSRWRELKKDGITGWGAHIQSWTVACVVNQEFNRSYGNVVSVQCSTYIIVLSIYYSIIIRNWLMQLFWNLLALSGWFGKPGIAAWSVWLGKNGERVRNQRTQKRYHIRRF